MAWNFFSCRISLMENSMMKKVKSSDIMSPKVTSHSGIPADDSSSPTAVSAYAASCDVGLSFGGMKVLSFCSITLGLSPD